MNDDLRVIWYHAPSDQIFQWGHLEAMFALLQPPQCTIAGYEINSWNDIEIIGLL